MQYFSKTDSGKRSYRLRFWGTSFLAPVISAVLLFLVYAIFQLFPFSQQIFAWGDMVQQSIPLLMDWKQILSGNFDLFLNTANAGGMSFWGVFLFFLSSPFSFLVVFVPLEKMYLFSNLLVLVKIAACAWTASLFFQRQFQKLSMVQTTALSVMYAFCGFALLYYQNMVWLDMMAIFPVLLMGLLDLIQKKRIWFYIVALSLTVAINYYLSYMVILFLVFAMGVYLLLVCPKEDRFRCVVRFVVSSLLSAVITAVFWLPSLLQYQHSGRTTSLLESLSSGGFFTSLTTTLPVIFCTASVVAILPIFFLAKLYRNRSARGLFVVFLLLLIPVIIEPINKMWHTGSYQAFPVRYGYITVMLGLCLTACFLQQCQTEPSPQESIVRQTKWPARILLAILLFLFAALMVVLLFTKLDVLSTYVYRLWMDSDSFLYFILFAGLATFLYCVLYGIRYYRMLSNRMFSIILCIMVACEAFFGSSIFIGASARSAWNYDNALMLASQEQNSDSLLRTKTKEKYFDANLVGALGYSTLSHYTSLTDQDFLYTMKKLGYSSYWMEVDSNGGTLLSDLLMANRYCIVKNMDESELSKSQINLEGLLYSIVENPAVTDFGVVFETNNLANLEQLPTTATRITLQQYLSDLFYHCGQVTTTYEPIQYSNVKWSEENGKQVLTKNESDYPAFLTYEISVQEAETLYFDCFDAITTNLTEPINGSFDLTVNGIRVESNYPSQSSNGLICLGSFENETVNVTLRLKTDRVAARSLGVFGLREDRIAAAAQELTHPQLTRSGNTITGTVTASGTNQYLFLPISYDEGYQVTVNGTERTVSRVFDAFMAVELDEGENQITLTYWPQGFRTGLILSLIGVGLFVGLLLLLRFWKRKPIAKWLNWPLYLLFWAGVVGAFVVVYILPLGIWIRY